MSATALRSSAVFTPADYAILERAYAALRGRAVCVTQAEDYPGLPTVAEVSWPGSSTEARWIIYRDGDGAVLDELGGAVARFPTLQAAVDAITATLDADHRAAVDAIPTTLQRRVSASGSSRRAVHALMDAAEGGVDKATEPP